MSTVAIPPVERKPEIKRRRQRHSSPGVFGLALCSILKS